MERLESSLENYGVRRAMEVILVFMLVVVLFRCGVGVRNLYLFLRLRDVGGIVVEVGDDVFFFFWEFGFRFFIGRLCFLRSLLLGVGGL